MLLSGIGVEDLPRILRTYLFCSPGLDRNLRCLPKSGGYYEQDHVDMLGFKIIEDRIADFNKRRAERNKATEDEK